MSIHKDNATGKWRVVYRYTDWTGETKQTSKRGFPTKREAQMWEHEQMLKHDAKLDMTFASFYEIYVEDKKERIRDNTWGTKNNIARTKILPYFGERKIAEIEPKDVIAWQNLSLIHIQMCIRDRFKDVYNIHFDNNSNMSYLDTEEQVLKMLSKLVDDIIMNTTVFPKRRGDIKATLFPLVI